MNLEYIELAIGLIGAIGLGGILTVCVQYGLTKKDVVSDIDIKRYNFYKKIYFRAVCDKFENALNKSKAKAYFKTLYIEVSRSEEKSLLLSKEVLHLLKDHHSNFDDDKVLSSLQKMLKKDFIYLKGKVGYPVKNRREICRYWFTYYISIALGFISFLLFFDLVDSLVKNDTVVATIIFAFFSISITCFILCLVYVQVNKYIIKL